METLVKPDANVPWHRFLGVDGHRVSATADLVDDPEFHRAWAKSRKS